ncbi:MAG: tRNA (N(6)-L-threonylcarbamoyladenosine(37)-C(2))-methylthiotransferase MtaB [Victivallaceae bacterium]|nr:tRNA (N(6)-L-threonylcarbamoyladenosine(37)-C(2))-methylthiotransferase MtaB [Victivallaceae bacterium]
MKRAFIVTLGCRLNQADSALIADRLRSAGYEISDGSGGVDLVVINSCAVTAQAVAKSRRALAKWRRTFPDAEIVVTGCAAEAEFDKFSAGGLADAVLTNPDKREIIGSPAHLRSREMTAASFSEHAEGYFPFRHRALVKIQEGCNNFCTYCIVPHVRGRERSRRVDEVLTECRNLIASGVPEIVLTGVNTCAYESDGWNLGRLVREICSFDGDFRVRLSSTEPHPNNLALLESLRECGGRFCRFLHLSLQHGDNAILRAMNRHYSREEYAEFVAAARSVFPYLHVGTDVIAGFPGEGEKEFESSLEFVRSMEFANVHVFTYSPRPGTPAAGFAKRVSPETAAARHEKLAVAAAESAARFRASQVGMELPVIFEEEKHGMLHGWSDNYLAVSVPVGSFPAGRIVNVRLA